MGKNKKPKTVFVMINTENFEVKVSKFASTTANIIGVHRNTINTMPSRAFFKGFLVIKTTEE